MLTEPVSPESFEPLEFWDEHKTKILIYAAVLIVVLGGYGLVQLVHHRRVAEAERLYASATSVADFQNIVQKFSGTQVGGNAALELADKLRAEGKYDESIKVLTDFRTTYRDHPLLNAAWASLAATYELQGKLDQALDTYQQVISKFPNAYTTPLAMLAEGHVYRTLGKKDDARRTYQDIVARHPETAFAREAMRETQFLGK
jgi:TolA-binding protein